MIGSYTERFTVPMVTSRTYSVGVGDRKRRYDIADPKLGEGIEYKSGSVPNDEKLAAEIDHDTILIKQGWNVKWVFRVEPQQWLQDRLKAGNIPWEMDHGAAPSP